jgi:hypothetical protein
MYEYPNASIERAGEIIEELKNSNEANINGLYSNKFYSLIIT